MMKPERPGSVALWLGCAAPTPARPTGEQMLAAAVIRLTMDHLGRGGRFRQHAIADVNAGRLDLWIDDLAMSADAEDVVRERLRQAVSRGGPGRIAQ